MAITSSSSLYIRGGNPITGGPGKVLRHRATGLLFYAGRAGREILRQPRIDPEEQKA